MSRGAPRVGTLGSWAVTHPAVRLDCLRCRRSVRRELADLVDRHGPELPLQAFLERCRCSACGSAEIELQVVAPTPFDRA